MAIIILHGNDIVSSRRKIDSFKTEKRVYLNIDLAKENPSNLSSTLNSTDLFASTSGRLILLENFTKLKQSDQDNIVAILNKIKKSRDIIVIWENEKLKPDIIKKISAEKIFLFELPKIFYVFLDSLKPRNGRYLKSLFDKLKHSTTPEQLFYSITKRVRTILMIKTRDYSRFDEVKGVQKWQLAKLQQQAKFWKENELISFYNKLFQIETRLKSNSLLLPLQDSLDILISSL